MNTNDKLRWYLIGIAFMAISALANEGQSGPMGWTVYGMVLGWLIAGWCRTFYASLQPERRAPVRRERLSIYDVELD